MEFLIEGSKPDYLRLGAMYCRCANIGKLPTPIHNRQVKVVSILHWREMTPQQKKWIRDKGNMVQGFPAGYIIDWSEAKWEYIEKQ